MGPFDGRVAAVIEDFVCTTPNQTRIFLPSFQKTEVKLRADVRYGPDDPTLWPQPYVESCCHLGAIPRKPDDLNDPLSIMWWDPTSDDFESFGAGVVNGLGELSGSKLSSLRKMMRSLESRIEDHKEAFPQQNKFLLLLVRAMQGAFTRLDSLKTTFTEMRVGVTEFQRYYLEVLGCLDYLEIYHPRMDGVKPPAESVANCIGAITNIPVIVQEFVTAGLPVWFLRPSTFWDSPARCNILEIATPLNPADVLCLSDHYPPFPVIFYGPSTDSKRHSALYTHSRKWLVFKDPFGGPKSKSIQLVNQYIFSLLSKARHLQCLQSYLLHQFNLLRLVNPLRPVNLLQPSNPLIVAKLYVLNVREHQLKHLVNLLLHFCMVHYLIHFF